MRTNLVCTSCKKEIKPPKVTVIVKIDKEPTVLCKTCYQIMTVE